MIREAAIVEGDGEGRERPAEAAPAKRAQILDGARRVFLAEGFAAASMGDIAKAAGVSKGTLYVYFDSKQALFHALIEELKRNTAERISAFDPDDHDIEAVLTGFAVRLMIKMSEPAHIGLVRAVMGAAEAFPELGRAFYEAGPAYGARRLASWLAAQEAAGALRLDDPEAAAWRFLGACGQPVLVGTLLGRPRPDEAEMERRAKGVVAAFLAAHAPR